MATTSSRGTWNSKLGFIMAAAGGAVGLGNIWRFPTETAENGGAAFLFVYVICCFLIGPLFSWLFKVSSKGFSCSLSGSQSVISLLLIELSSSSGSRLA